MKYPTDQDGKSKTSSAADTEHYPDRTKAVLHVEPPPDPSPDREQIAARAHEIWIARGRPEGTAEQDWAQAEAELKQAGQAHAPVTGVRRKDGSVQP